MRAAFGAFAVLLGAASSIACSSSNASSGPPKPAGPPGLSITALHPSGGPTWTPGSGSCVELGRDADETIGVEVKLDNWTLRPPYTCGATLQCGYLRVRVDPQGDNGAALSEQAAASLVPVGFASLPGALGQHTIRVELRGDHNGPVIDKTTGLPYAVDLPVTLGAPGTCGGPPTDGGSDAGDASTEAGDASTEAGDAATDSGDASTEAGDAAMDSGDASTEAGDAGAEAGDAATDSGAEAGDAATD